MATTLQSSRFTEAGLKALSEDNLTGWTDYTAGSPSNVSNIELEEYRYRRVGDSIEIQGAFKLDTSGAVTSSLVWTEANLMPSGLTVNTALLAAETGSIDATGSPVAQACGTWLALDESASSGSDNFSGICTFLDVNNEFQFIVPGGDKADTTSPFTWAEDDKFSFMLKVPVTEYAGSQNSLVGFSEATSTALGLVEKNKWQQKDIGSTNISGSDQDFLEFTSLDSSKVYKYTYHVSMRGTADSVRFKIKEGTTEVKSWITGHVSTSLDYSHAGTHIFNGATSVKLRVEALDGNDIDAEDEGQTSTWAILEELNNYELESSDW